MINYTSAAWGKLKSFTMRFGRQASQYIMIIGGGRPLNIGDMRVEEEAARNSIAVASIRWIQRNWNEAPISVGRINEQDAVKDMRSPLLKLLKKPNIFYSGLNLWKGTVTDYIVTGNAYWIKGRSEVGATDRGRVTSLWWVPSPMIEPVGSETDPTVFIDHYVYTVDNEEYELSPEDVVHFRDGFDPSNPRKGLSGFASLIREFCTDNEAAQWTWALLHNKAIPGIIISPGKDVAIDSDEADKIKNEIDQRFTGNKRGATMVMTAAVKVEKLGFSPDEMNLRDVRRIPEERVTAVIGVPAVVVGMGAGLERSTFANFAEAREAAYEGCLIPIQGSFAEDLELQLLPDFHNVDTYTVWFDTSKVRVLQPDINAIHTRARGDLLVGGIMLDEFRKQIGLAPLPNGQGQVWYVPNGISVSQSPGQGMIASGTQVAIGGDTGAGTSAGKTYQYRTLNVLVEADVSDGRTNGHSIEVTEIPVN